MTKMMIAVVALALAVAMPALAQSTTTQPSTQGNPTMTQPPDQSGQPARPDTSQPAQNQPNQAPGSAANGTDSQSGQRMAGMISADGKTFTSNNTTYNITNSDAAKAYANQALSVEYEMGTNNSIRITKVFLSHPQH